MKQINFKTLSFLLVFLMNMIFIFNIKAQVHSGVFGEGSTSTGNFSSYTHPEAPCGTVMEITISGHSDFKFLNYPYGTNTYTDDCMPTGVTGLLTKTTSTDARDSDSDQEYTITFNPPVDNFEFSIHNIELRHEEEVYDFTFNGQSIDETNGLTLSSSHYFDPISNGTLRPNGAIAVTPTEAACGLIKINKSGISSVTFKVKRIEWGGNFLTNYSYEETECCTAPTLCCSDEFMVPVIGSTGNDLICSQIYDNGVGVGIGTTTPGSYSVSPGQTWLGVTPASFTGDFKLSVEGVTRSESYYSYSDRRFKKNIAPIENPLSLVRQLNGVTYNWNNSQEHDYQFSDIPQVGFIAQELETVIPEAVLKDENGYYTVNYTTIIPLLTEALKEQDTKILELEEKISELEKMYTSMNATKLKEENVNKLFQNSPNPSSSYTKVEYFLGSGSDDAYILIYDITGKQLDRLPLDQTEGFGAIEINTVQYSKGTYIYTLVVDGEIISTKKMVVKSVGN